MNRLAVLRPPLLPGLCLAALLSACGGDSDQTPAAPPANPGTPSTVTMAIGGGVIKGPVAGASVCAYAVDAGARGQSLGPCTTTAADGAYSLPVTTSAAAVLLEASGGSYTDETTAATTALPSGSLLSSLVPAAAGAATAYLTPLTTLAVNTARAGGVLDLASFSQSAAALLSSFGLDPALDIRGSAPVVSGAVNAYGQALQAISRMANVGGVGGVGGTPLADILASTQPGQLASAFRDAFTAVSTPVVPPPPTTPPTTPNVPEVPEVPVTPTPPTTPVASPSASGSLTVAGGTVADFVPDATGFTISVSETRTSYRFEKQVSFLVGGNTATSTAYLEVSQTTSGAGGPVLSTVVTAHLDPAAGAAGGVQVATCNGGCGIRFSSPAGSSHPVTLAFSNTVVGKLTLNGSLVGEAPGAAWSVADLPRTTDGVVGFGSVDRTVVTAEVSTGTGPGGSVRSVFLRLQGGGLLTLTENFSANGGATGNGASFIAPGGSPAFCVSSCAFSVTESATGTVVALNGTQLSDGSVLRNTLFIGKTQGTLNSASLGGFSPVRDSIESRNNTRELVFSVLGTSAQSGISLVSVKTRGTVVTEVSVSTGIGSGVYQCFEQAASFLGIPACAGGTVSANGRTVTFSGLTVVGGGIGVKQPVTLDGVLTAAGL